VSVKMNGLTSVSGKSAVIVILDHCYDYRYAAIIIRYNCGSLINLHQ